jgi:hypothetical protein
MGGLFARLPGLAVFARVGIAAGGRCSCSDGEAAVTGRAPPPGSYRAYYMLTARQWANGHVSAGSYHAYCLRARGGRDQE